MAEILSRRSALKWMTGSAAASASVASGAPNETEPAPPDYPVRFNMHDPDYSKPATGPWERVLTEDELKLVTVLADLILPKDGNGPAASEIGVPDFINEWVSAPFEPQRSEGQIVRGGLSWLNTAGFQRHGKAFVELASGEQTALLNSVADETKASKDDRVGVRFFQTFRQLCLDGYYTHSATWKQLGYTGNVTLGGPYPGVPDEVVRQFGLEDVA